MYELVVGAIFKNESHIIAEWIQHYLREGVEHFYLIDNGSTDDYGSAVEPYASLITVFVDDRKNSQVELYNKYFMGVLEFSKWFMVVDLDEFTFARYYNRIPDYLNSVPDNVTQIAVVWKRYGSSGHIKQPKSVIQGFTRRKAYNKDGTVFCVKSICRSDRITKFNVHFCHNTGGSEILSNSFPIALSERSSSWVNMDEDSVMTSELHCNHYVIQSWEFYKRVKMSRGDVNMAHLEKSRDHNYFRMNDYNEVEDRTLADKVYA
jgi:hypothetical protein